MGTACSKRIRRNSFFYNEFIVRPIKLYYRLSKTFGSIPTVHTTLNNEGGGDILFFNISGVSNDSYSISFNSAIPNNNYSIKTKAAVTGDYSLHQTTTQSFREQIIEGSTEYTINYPSAFSKKPVISITLERKTSYSVSDPGAAGDSFIDGREYYIATDTNTWRRVTMTEIIRAAGSTGDTSFDANFYYVCIDGTLWGKYHWGLQAKQSQVQKPKEM